MSAYRTLASESRMHILHLLQGQDEPLTVDEVAAGVGLHINTAREHLDRLVEGGFVSRESEIRKTRGRPRMLYRSVDRMAAATMDVRAREHLTRMLIAGYGKAMTSPARSAEAEGRRWADELAGGAAPGVPPVASADGTVPSEVTPADDSSDDGADHLADHRADHRADEDADGRADVAADVAADNAPDDAAGFEFPAVIAVPLAGADGALCALAPPWDQLAALEQHFEDLGFDPEVDLATLQVHLRRCPLMDLAHQRTEVVCSVHLGLAQGVLARQGGTLTADRLEPFVGPRHCVLYLSQS